jgi:hypothetical protein
MNIDLTHLILDLVYLATLKLAHGTLEEFAIKKMIRLWQYQLFCMAQNVGLTKRQKSILEAAEMRFLRSVAGYRLIDHRRNEDTREELQIIDIN